MEGGKDGYEGSQVRVGRAPREARKGTKGVMEGYKVSQKNGMKEAEEGYEGSQGGEPLC